MKLSDIKGERVFDVIADLIDPVQHIAQDKEITLFKREKAPKGVAARDFAIQKLMGNVPKLLKRHKRDLSVILATIKGVPVDEYVEGLNLAQLSVDLLELMNDAEFINFFTSAAKTTSAYGSPSGNTEAPVQ